MKISQCILTTCLLIITIYACANNVLNPPTEETIQCNQSYENAAAPKIAQNIQIAMTQLCKYAEGSRVTQRIILNKETREPQTVILSCVGNNQVIFSCTFSTNEENN